MKFLVFLARAFMSVLQTIRRTLSTLAFLCIIAVSIASHTIEPVTDLIGGLIASTTGTETIADQRKRNLVDSQARIEANEVEIDDLKSKRAKLLQENESLRNRQSVVLGNKRMSPQQAVKNTTDKIRARTAKVAVSNLSALPAEALPVYGAGFAAAATTIELRAACISMKELQELQVAFGFSDIDNDVSRICGLEVPTKEELWQKIKNSPSSVIIAAKEGLSVSGEFVRLEALNYRLWIGDRFIETKHWLSDLEVHSPEEIQDNLRKLKFWD